LISFRRCPPHLPNKLRSSLPALPEYKNPFFFFFFFFWWLCFHWGQNQTHLPPRVSYVIFSLERIKPTHLDEYQMRVLILEEQNGCIRFPLREERTRHLHQYYLHLLWVRLLSGHMKKKKIKSRFRLGSIDLVWICDTYNYLDIIQMNFGVLTTKVLGRFFEFLKNHWFGFFN
jgi:hypothetical protein